MMDEQEHEIVPVGGTLTVRTPRGVYVSLRLTQQEAADLDAAVEAARRTDPEVTRSRILRDAIREIVARGRRVADFDATPILRNDEAEAMDRR